MLRTFALLVMSSALAFGAAEGALRYLDPGWTIFFPPICFRPDLFEQVPWGYRLHPSRTFEHRHPPGSGRTVRIRSNADGFRSGRDFHDGDPRRRIVVLGDSLVFGEGVDESERFTEVMESASPAWRVDNLGMIGYGADLMLRAFDAVGRQTAPDAVIVAIYTDDVRRVSRYYSGVGFPIPRFVLEDGRLETIAYPEPHLWDRTRFFQGILYLYWRYTPATFRLNEAILDRFAELSREVRFKLGIVFLPDRQDDRDDRRRRVWLGDYARARRVSYVDLTAAVQDGGGEKLYLPNDSHWNADGHRLVAERLLEFIRRDLNGEGAPG
jgi:hypothetical protein